jgi:3-oxoacyl-[acyl-carrier protein] reductase
MSKLLRSKTVMISGASRGIGRAIAKELAVQGANISFNFLQNEQGAADVAGELNELGASSKAFQADIRDYEAVKSWVEETKKIYGALDIVINNAGVIKDKALALMDTDDWHNVINTNLDGTFNLTRASIISLIKQKSGIIINISSVSGIVGLPRQTNYAASKAGIIGFTKSLAREVGPYNIRVNAVAPGFIETEMLDDLSEEYRKQIIKEIPLNRLGKVEEVAKIVNFLVSEDAGYVTGQTFVIDGGLSTA